MRKPTGPGKVQDNLLDPPATRKGVAGLLYNFDFDDASVKPEHQDWLKRIVVPQLLASPNSSVSLKGMASRKGSDAYNSQLSQRRVDAVKAFLVQQGVLQASQVRATFIGEAGAELAGRADGTDDEIDRAVSVDMVPPERKVIPFFDTLIPGEKPRGFGRNLPQWVMVPAMFARRSLRLRNAEGMLVRTSTPSIVRLRSEATAGATVNDFIVPSDNIVIEFVGGQPGSGVIEVFELNGEMKRKLEVDCLPRREVSVAFHFVADKKHKTDRTHFSVEFMLRDSNLVFNDAANVFFTEASSKPLTFLNQDLGDPLTETTMGNKFEKLTRHGNPSARINAFFVWNWQSFDDKPRDDTDARADDIPGSNVVFEDAAGVDEGITMAHEFAHCLGLEHEDKNDVSLKKFVTWPFTDQRGSLVRREDALLANKFALSVKGS